MKLKHKDKIIQDFGDKTPEEILEWVREIFTTDGHPIFDSKTKELWKLSKDKDKIIHETMVSYTELLLIE